MRQESTGIALLICSTLAGCSHSKTIEVVNTSGTAQQVAVYGSGLRDLYRIDSLAEGKTLCWTIPDHFGGDQVILLLTASLGRVESPYVEDAPSTEAWIDSLSPDQNWVVRVHAPSFVEGNSAWRERRERREAEAARWLQAGPKKWTLPPDLMMQQRANLLRDPNPRSADAPHYVQQIQKQNGKSCKP
jgi:hypothetical protein